MEEQFKPKSFEERMEENRLKEIAQMERMDDLRKKTMDWLKTDPKVQDFLKDYHPSSVNNFLESYAREKALFMEYGEKFGEYAENRSLEYLESARNGLVMIQIKKLYDYRRRWGANLVKSDKVTLGIDFLKLAEDVLNTDIIPPISNEDFQLFLKFLNSPNYKINSKTINRTNCGELSFIHTVDDSDDEELGDWFSFHNLYTGNSKYLLLPDTRGEKEYNYVALAAKEEEKQLDEKREKGELPKPPPPDPRPFIPYHDKTFALKFITRFESKDVQKKYKGYQNYYMQTQSNKDDIDDSAINEQVEEIVEKMLSLETPLPIKANADWRLAIVEAWNNYERQSIIDTMPVAYEDYLFHIENGIAFSNTRDGIYESIINQYKKRVLRGREILGEPNTFDF
jgi:hypothetical protein